MLELSGINVHYGKIHVLRHVTLRVGAGEVAALIGPNAAGKTTTLRALVGLKECASGVIRFAGEPIQRLSTPDRIRLGAFHRADRDRLDKDFETVFAIFPKLAERRHQKAGLMSGGEQQMLAIARGLMAKPRLLLLDEPTLGLAPIIVEEIELAISALAGKGMTILVAEQNAAMAMRVAHRVYVLKSGRISLEGTPAELAKSAEIQRLYLGV